MPCKEFRIGVFFDGTGNNKENDLAGKSANGPSNVAKLSDLYHVGSVIKDDELKKYNRPLSVCEIHTKMIYIEGVGTLSPKMVWTRGKKIGTQYAPGAHGTIPVYEWSYVKTYQDNYTSGNLAGTEGATRINDAITQVENALKGKGSGEYNRIIDVFGFSRGAAMARDFMNTIRKSNRKTQYEFGFIGLFDTVASFGAGGDNINLKPRDPAKNSEHETLPYEAALRNPKAGLAVGMLSPRRASNYLKSIKEDFEPYNFHLSANSAQKITHLVAADEYRFNFPLSNIKGAGIDNELIGVHSDVGGGYPPISHDKSSYYPSNKKYYTENLLLDPFTDYDAGKLAAADAKATQQGLGSGWSCEAVYHNNILGAGRSYYNVYCKQERTVTDDLQNVGLALMYNQAKIGGVPLNDFSQPVAPADLKNYAYPAASNPSFAAQYSPRQPILDKYAHRSAVDTKETHHHRDVGPHDGVDSMDDVESYAADAIGMGMNYDANGKPVRNVFDNVPGQAVLKT